MRARWSRTDHSSSYRHDTCGRAARQYGFRTSRQVLGWPMIVGFQEWRDLLFLHWRVPASDLRARVHPRLAIEEHDGSAWVSMTPFTLRRGSVRGLPALPDFHELNFRTYVTHPQGGPGIW